MEGEKKQTIDRPVDVELVGRHVSIIFSLVGRIFVRCCEVKRKEGRRRRKVVETKGRNRTAPLFIFLNKFHSKYYTKRMESVACVKLVPRDRLCRDMYPFSQLSFDLVLFS
jgi:hypothetical protein